MNRKSTGHRAQGKKTDVRREVMVNIKDKRKKIKVWNSTL
jgi:hypothetical protein